MVFVETQPVVAEFIDQFPGVEVLGVGADRDLGFEVASGQRVGEFVALFQVVELLGLGQQVEDEDFHGRVPCELEHDRPGRNANRA